MLCLLEPRQELLLGHLQVLDVGGGMVQTRSLAGLLVGEWESALQVAAVLLELITPPLFWLDALVKISS